MTTCYPLFPQTPDAAGEIIILAVHSSTTWSFHPAHELVVATQCGYYLNGILNVMMRPLR
jgi:hypothetical protein